MLKILAMLFITALLPLESFAGQVSGRCTGVSGRQRIVLGFRGDPDNTRTGRGTISIDGRILSVFEGRELRVNKFMLRASARNSRGDVIEARLTDFINKSGYLTRLDIRDYGVRLRNVPVRCTF